MRKRLDKSDTLLEAPRAPIRAFIARRLLRRVATIFPVSFQLPNGQVVGRADTRIAIHSEDFFHRLGRSLKIGLGESFMAGDWNAAEEQDLADVLTPIAARLDQLIPKWARWLRAVLEPRQPNHEANTQHGARKNIARHYDLSNEMFATFLDPTMTYSSAFFAGRESSATWSDLQSAQEAKIERVLDCAQVGAGDRVLEIGTGWGQLALQAGHRGAKVTSITLSQEQLDLAKRRIEAAGLSSDVEVCLKDYREVAEQFDAVVSVEMIEAVGEEYWPEYFAAIARSLIPGGKFGLQAILMQHQRMVAARRSFSWIHKYIFPGGLIPSFEAIEYEAAKANLKIVGVHYFGADYARTLRLWREQFLSQGNGVRELGFDQVFIRMWEYYLAYSEAGFRSGHLDVAQFAMERTR